MSIRTIFTSERRIYQNKQKKTRDAGFPAFFVPPSRPRGADEAKRRDATEGQEGGTGKMRFAQIRDYSRWDFSCVRNQPYSFRIGLILTQRKSYRINYRSVKCIIDYQMIPSDRKIKDSTLNSINNDEIIKNSIELCTNNLKNIEEKLNSLNKLEIISMLSILTQTEFGRQLLEEYPIVTDKPCLHYIIGLALKNEICTDVEPSAQDIESILDSLETYFANYSMSIKPKSHNIQKDDIIFRAQMHESIGQANPEKYPFQMCELLTGTFGQLDDYFILNYGFTIDDTIKFSEIITENYENLGELKLEESRNNNSDAEKVLAEFFSKTREIIEIIPDDICKLYALDVVKFTKYLKEFSCSFGDGDISFISSLDKNVFLIKPILYQSGRYYIPIPQDLLQKLPYIFEKLLEHERQNKSDIWQKYIKIKSDFTERKVTEYLSRVFKKEDIHENLYYRVKKGNECEVDHIIKYFNNILICEEKSGNFSISPRMEELDVITTKLKRLICDAHDQGIRTRDFIKQQKTALFLNSEKERELEIVYNPNRTNFILINVTLEPLLSFSSGLKNIESLGIFSNSEYPWSVTLFDLDIITRHIKSPSVFIHYIERRLEVQTENLFLAIDELTFLSYYLEHGNFNINSDEKSKLDLILIESSGYLKKFDQYYLYGKEEPTLVIETEIKDIISELEQIQQEGFTDITNALLDLHHETRKELIDMIQKMRNNTLIDGQRHDFSFFTKNRIGITCFSQKGTENLESSLSTYCSLKKYQFQADRWIGVGINVLDSEHFISSYLYYGDKWIHDEIMDQNIKLAIDSGLIKDK